MGNIVTWSDVVNKYRDAGSVGDASTMDASYIYPAEEYIKGTLVRRFSDPYSDPGYSVKDLIVDEAYRRICLSKAPKKADALKKDIIERLNDILSGKVILFDGSGNEIERDRTIMWSNTENYTPVFGMGDITDMEVDPDQIDDEEDARG